MVSTLTTEFDLDPNSNYQMPPSQLTRRTSANPQVYRPSRVEKPRSNHNSPKALERRKTTSGTKRYATLDDHFNFMYGLTGEEEEQHVRRELTRPMSWHPSSQSQSSSRSSNLVVQTSCQDWSRNPLGSDFYSLSAQSPMYPEQYPNYTAVPYGPRGSENSWQTQQTPYTMSAYSTPSTEPMPWYLPEWTRKNQAEASNSRDGSADFLPIQHPSTNEVAPPQDEEMEDSGKELVGMGLYDQPESSLLWNTSTLLEGSGKGLKLEETFQPQEEESDEEDEEAEGDDASTDDESIDELPVAETRMQLPISHIKVQTPNNMDGQSFFFDDDESCTKEWWYHQLKQPSVPVRDAGFGYGWL